MQDKNRSPFLSPLSKKDLKGMIIKPESNSQTWLARKRRQIIRPWKEDALLLKEVLGSAQKSIKDLNSFLLSLRERKTFSCQILKKFFILMSITGIISMGISLFLFFLGDSGAVFYLHIIFIAFSFLCLLLLIKRLKP